MHWSFEMQCYLLEEVKKNSCLWRRQDKNFRNKLVRRAVYDEITSRVTQKFNLKGPVFSEDVRRKFMNIKIYYQKQLEKLKTIQSKPERKPPIKWELFNYASFLSDHNGHHDPVNSKIFTKLTTNKTYDDFEIVNENDIEDENNFIDAPEQDAEEVAATSCGSGNSLGHQIRCKHNLNTMQPVFIRPYVPDRKRKIEHDPYLGEAIKQNHGYCPWSRRTMDYPWAPTVSDSYGFTERDEFTIFGEYVACRLRRISDRQTILQLQNRINNLMFKTEMGLLNGSKQ